MINEDDIERMERELELELELDYKRLVKENEELNVKCVRLENELQQLKAKEGPFNEEQWTVDKLLGKLQEYKEVAGGSSCVSFECLVLGASSLWHQTHKKNFEGIDRKPKELSKLILRHCGKVEQDFPKQVLDTLVKLRASTVQAVEWFQTISSSDGSGHGDLGDRLAEMSGMLGLKRDSRKIL